MAKLSDLKNIDEVIEEHRGTDPEFRERWDRARFARAVAVKIIEYRTEHGLTQTQLAKEVTFARCCARTRQGSSVSRRRGRSRDTKLTALLTRHGPAYFRGRVRTLGAEEARQAA